MRRLLVAGSREFTNRRILELLDSARQTLAFAYSHMFDTVIHGGARGVDTLAGEWAKRRSMPVEVYPADWDRHGKSAGYRRNVEMVEAADAAIIIWDGKSKGTKHTIDLMTEAGKPYVLVVRPL